MSDETMTKSRLQETMQAERHQWEEAIAAIGRARMTLPGYAGVWSARDVVAHVTAYEQWMLDALEALARGEAPPPSLLDDGDMERRNLAAHELTHHLSLDDVQAAADRVWRGLTQAVAGLDEETLTAVSRAPEFVKKHWDDQTSLWEAIAGLTYEHYEEHLPDFHAWVATATTSSAG
ncbi:MAG TPA: maleylpyruvate isomerase N-terminal domain-containing protein [Ktedonobacterales bacterium]|jgi:hypothetical protein